jgi:hypothetical protein
MNSYTATDYPITSSQTWGPISTTTSSGSTARTTGSTSGMSQSLIHGPTDKSSVPTGWYSTPSRSDYTTLLTQKGASGSRNYPMHSGASYSTYQANRAVTVTELLKLIPYYCLNHSTWPLSNNIEVTCRLCRVKPGKSLTSQDRQLYIKTHTKASLEINKSQIIT